MLQLLWNGTRVAALRVGLAATAIAVPAAAWSASNAVLPEWRDYYQVADASLLHAARYVDGHHGDGAVIVREDFRGWAIGWWFEGLTGASIVTGADERWLAFPTEIQNARLARRFFDQQLTVPQVLSLAAEYDVDLLVFQKWEWIGWMPWLEDLERENRVAYDDDEFMIVDVGGRPQRSVAVVHDRPGTSVEVNNRAPAGVPGLVAWRV
jgi:hypothetical protein